VCEWLQAGDPRDACGIANTRVYSERWLEATHVGRRTCGHVVLVPVPQGL
jgi:hypothetical protein